MSNASRGDVGVAVTLGAREYRLVPQRIGRIRRKVAAVVEMFGAVSGADGLDEGVDEIGAVLHEGLGVFIPDLAPLHELAGYGSEADYRAREKWERERDEARDAYAEARRVEAGLDDTDAATWADLDDDEREGFEFPAFVDPYDEAADKSPTPPEILHAIETIFEIHGGQRLVRLLKSVVDPTAIKAIIRSEMLRVASGRSRISPSTSGGSGSTSSSTSEPTPPTPESAD